MGNGLQRDFVGCFWMNKIKRTTILKLNYIVHICIPIYTNFCGKNVGYAREYPGTTAGPPTAPKRPRPMNKATALLWPDQGRSWADPVNNFGPAREESSNDHWVCWAVLNQAWEVTFQPQPGSTAKANSAASPPLERACMPPYLCIGAYSAAGQPNALLCAFIRMRMQAGHMRPSKHDTP